MKSSMQGKGVAAPDPKPSPSVNMANITRLSLLIADSDAQRAGEAARMLRELGLERVALVDGVPALLDVLKTQAFDLLLCADQLGDEDGLAVLRAVRKLAPATFTAMMRPRDRAAELLPEGVGAIELPLSRSSLQRLLDEAASPHGGLWCEVPALSLTDILQMYHQARRSITVLLSGPVAGRIRLEGGEIVDAESNDDRGMAALSRLLEAETGLLRTEAPKAGHGHSISGPFESVLLEAAQKLDERRRDSLIITDAGSVSGSVLHPAAPPSLQAHAPNPESFIAPPSRRRRQAWLAALSLVVSVAFAFGAASYLGRIRTRPRPHENPPGSASQESSSRGDGLEVEQSSRALEPPPNALPELPSDLPAPTPSIAPARAGGPQPGPAARAPANSASALPRSFELRITSKPSHATVTEGGRALGKTPLTIAILESSVAGGPREFVVRLPGYFSGRVVQAASSSNVNSSVVLSPRPGTVDVPDGGGPDSEEQAVDDRSGLPSGKRKDLGIRLRR
jgi:CheY-like chemotaxis protein